MGNPFCNERIQDDIATYWGNQVQKSDGWCYGVACSEKYILVREYEGNGSDAEIIILKKRL